MMRFKLNDRYIRGTVAFESYGETAIMSYVGEPKLPLNTQYDINGNKWRVVQVRRSIYNSQIINVDMVLVEQEQ
jgi:hypothetical protein